MPGIKLTIPRHATTKESIKKPTFVNAQNVSENQRQGCKELFNFFLLLVKLKRRNATENRIRQERGSCLRTDYQNRKEKDSG